MDISEVCLQLRARFQSNQFLIELLSKIDDRRVKRIVQLLNQMPQSEIPEYAQEIVQICADLPGKTGFHPRLHFLSAELNKAVDFLREHLKRVGLYLDHIAANGNVVPDATSQLVRSAAKEQMDLSTVLCREARSAYTDATCYPPGPEALERGLVNGVPEPIGEDYDPRWDPVVRMPGSPHGKFFKFPGNYFAPDENNTKFDHFLLTQTHSDLIKNMDRKFSHALAKQKKVNRDVSNRDTAMLDVPQPQNDFDKYAEDNKYDLDSIVLHTPTAPRDITATIAPYISNGQAIQRPYRGLWQPEDLNRSVEVMESGRLGGMVKPVEQGCQIIFDQRLGRAKQV